MPRSFLCVAVGVVSLAAAPFAVAGAPVQVVLPASLDNTLYEDAAGGLSNALGPNIFAGQTRFFGVRRALVKFDLTSIPAGATVQSAVLTLGVTQSVSGDQTHAIYRVTGAWGEGTSDSGPDTGTPGGAGEPATPNDATWVHRFYNTALWSAPGGDAAASPSASTLVGDVGSFTWSGTQVKQDVQNWVSNPSTNNGWMVRGTEGGLASVKRYASRENTDPSLRPKLTVTYTVPAPCVGDLNGDHAVNTADLTAFLGAFGTTVTPGTGADLDGNGSVNTADLVIFLARFGQPC